VLQEGEEIIAEPGAAFSQALAVPVLGGRSHDGVEIAFEPSPIFAA
jgi:hypothetical protein